MSVERGHRGQALGEKQNFNKQNLPEAVTNVQYCANIIKGEGLVTTYQARSKPLSRESC